MTIGVVVSIARMHIFVIRNLSIRMSKVTGILNIEGVNRMPLSLFKIYIATCTESGVKPNWRGARRTKNLFNISEAAVL